MKVNQQTVSLADFLGWQEDKVYFYKDVKLMIKDNMLHVRDYYGRDWLPIRHEVGINDFVALRESKRADVKYYLKIKDEFIEFCNLESELSYLNHDMSVNAYYLSDTCVTENVTCLFTELEINSIQLVKPFMIEMFDKIEYEE